MTEQIGYLAEIFSSIQGEGGSVKGSCFGKRQIFVRFAGCNLSDGAFESDGCFWCDSKYAQEFEKESFFYETAPGSQKFHTMKNPIPIKKIVEILKTLITKDLHSISFTGGEPIVQYDYLLSLIKALRTYKINFPLYLETNGSIVLTDKQMKELAPNLKYCCCDIKDKSAKAASDEKWKQLVECELNTIEKLVLFGVLTFVKIVVTAETSLKDIKWIGERLSKIKYSNGEIIGVAIQPATFKIPNLKSNFSLTPSQLNEIFYTISESIPPESLTLSIQAHKFLNLL